MPKPNEFEYDCRIFRIVFQHDRSRALAAHELHNVTIVRDKHGKHCVVCATCRFLQLLPLSKKVKRSTRCRIQVQKMGGWQDVATGTSKLNTKAGDSFCREVGRNASLLNALASGDFLRPSFVDAALDCYNEVGQ